MREKQTPGAERRDDAALLELLMSDPEKGMNEIIRRYSGLVASVISQRLSCCGCVSTDIEDCAADTFSDFYIFRERYDPSRCGLPSWLASIARHKAADFADKNRGKGVNAGLDDPDATLGSVPDGASVLFPAGSEPADGFDETELRERLLREVKALGEPDSSILFRKYYLGQTSAKIAKDLGMKPTNVDTRASRAVAKLREFFAGEK